MNKKNTADHGGSDDGAASLLPEQKEKDSAAGATEPGNDNHAGQHELSTQAEFITAPSPVDAEASATGSSLSSPLASDRDADDEWDYSDYLRAVCGNPGEN